MLKVTRRRACARTHRGGPLLRGAVLGALLLALCAPARADDNPLQRANDLRNAADKDWANKAYAEAVKKLRSALEIYARVDGERAIDRAITLRALIWNLVRADDSAGIMKPFEALMDVAAADVSTYPEVTSAFSAAWEAANGCSGYEEAEAILAPIEEAAGKRALQALQGQALHSLGSLARKHEEPGLALAYLGSAITLRREIGDAVGETWSLNNLANFHLAQGALTPALKPLRRAYELVHAERIAEPQQSVAWNVKKAIALFAKNPDERAVPWLRALRKASATSSFGCAVPPSHLDRQALAIAQRIGNKTNVLKLTKALVKQSAARSVPEVQADLGIRAALAATQAGKAKQARTWLQKLKLGDGPCRDHLEARRKTALAITYADKRGKKHFPAKARDAATAWRGLGDFAGRRGALGALMAAARAAGLEGLIPKVAKEADEAQRAGGPGGDGGSASSAGDRSKASDVPLDGAVFSISMNGDQIRIEDRVANHKLKRALRWKPSRLGVNGLSFTLFGGYLVVESMNYGGSASAPPAPGATTLDDLGIYWPIPAKGALVILKNGAVRYETTPVSPR